ncbi:MAG: hypothetical protein NT118_13665 [Lentisphaerae bacterium]|nr:hypothetical protein [Lentisphaerota bacterium]
MRHYKVAAFLAVCMLGSLTLNVYQKHTFDHLKKLPLIQNMGNFRNMKMEYPINGLKDKDIAAILKLLKSIPEDESILGKGIFSIDTFDDNHVNIDRGHIDGIMRGGGEYIRFLHTNKGWEFYGRDKPMNWVY